MEIPTFENKKDLFAFLIKNKKSIIAKKKAEIKHADGFAYSNHGNLKGPVDKANINTDGSLDVEAVINTTLLFDSHKDVHLDGIWTKSINESNWTIHNQEHGTKFRDIIAEGPEVKTYVQKLTWKELGFNYEGSTEALTYNSNIKPDKNSYMFDKYNKGEVRNHSVEMQYVKYTMAVNDPDYKEEYAEWQKIFPLVANKEDALESGYMFPIYEAKHLGGAAVPKGSNFATPTINTSEAGKTTSINIEPPEGTQKSNLMLNFIN